MSGHERLQRLLRMVELLQSGRTLDASELGELCQVSRRTVFRDLRMLQHSGVPLVYQPDRGGYSIATATNLRPADLTLEETLAVLLTCHALGSGSGIPFLRTARSAALKLLGNLPAHLRDYLGELTEKIDVRLEPQIPLKDGNWYAVFTGAMADLKAVRITYRPLTEPGRQPISTVVHPYRMLFARRTWYVIGRSSLHRGVRTFHLGRIRKADVLDTRYRIPRRFTLDRHLGNAWFLIRERGRSVRVVVRFQPLVAENVAEVLWHKSQHITRNDDGSIDFRVTVGSLREIVWWILGYGDQAEVLEPQALREEMRRHAENMRRLYRDGSRQSPE